MKLLSLLAFLLMTINIPSFRVGVSTARTNAINENMPTPYTPALQFQDWRNSMYAVIR